MSRRRIVCSWDRSLSSTFDVLASRSARPTSTPTHSALAAHSSPARTSSSAFRQSDSECPLDTLLRGSGPLRRIRVAFTC